VIGASIGVGYKLGQSSESSPSSSSTGEEKVVVDDAKPEATIDKEKEVDDAKPEATIDSTVKKAPTLFQLIYSVALQGGKEFGSTNNYQSPALAFLQWDAVIGGSRTERQTVQTYALVCIYFAANDFEVTTKAVAGAIADDWLVHTNWAVSATDECTWYGVSCDENGDVTDIFLPNNNLLGILAPEVVLLKDTLKTLHLSSNDKLGGIIPSTIGALPLLEEFSISDCSFTGPVPSEIGSLSAMQTFAIQGNSVTGSVPKGLCDIDSKVALTADCDEVSCSCCTTCF